MFFISICFLMLSAVQANRVYTEKVQMNDGHWIPGIAFGTYVYNLTERTGVYQSVITAVEGGCRHIDTAYLYLTEDLVGKAVENVIDRGIVKREDLFITTKLSFRVLTRAQVIPSIKESLKRLKLDYVDLVLIHTPCDVLGLKPGFPKKSECSRNHTLEVWKGLEDAKRLCLTRSIGVSNFNSTDMASILADSDTVPAVNQIETNPTFAHQELVAYCQSKNIVVTGYAPFGFLVSRPFNDLALPPTVDDPFLVSQAEKYDVTVFQILLRYLIDRCIIPIAASLKPEHIKSNMRTAGFALREKAILRINKYDRNVKIDRCIIPTFASLKKEHIKSNMATAGFSLRPEAILGINKYDRHVKVYLIDDEGLFISMRNTYLTARRFVRRNNLRSYENI